MNYQVGNPVIHWTYGTGMIVAIDEKKLAGKTRLYYVVDTGHLTIWVPTDEAGEKSLRPPAERMDFKSHLSLLSGPGDGLSDQPYERKNQLSERMQKRELATLCGVIRDLTHRSQHHNLNENDKAVLKHAKEYLLDEWELSLGTPRSNALDELEILLGRHPAAETTAS